MNEDAKMMAENSRMVKMVLAIAVAAIALYLSLGGDTFDEDHNIQQNEQIVVETTYNVSEHNASEAEATEAEHIENEAVNEAHESLEQFMQIACPFCHENFSADVTRTHVDCPHCGHTSEFAG
ncbi:MAG: hypothetical protein K6G87_16865 [Butyrivibrio sp.]|uniref:hypothetical protein n=1 Tax=Butyrivibrio sp. TaxID=28121 RepID=UPI0025FA0536|nr:hypothetical protein [Butyrivibrio sp.]MCR5772897.1 hypothetical protein [Butyrivibrio sp.]